MNRRRFCGRVAVCVAGLCSRLVAQDPAKPLFSFGVVADAQYADQDTLGTRFYRESPKKLAACVDDLNARDLAFVIDVGDLIDKRFESFGTMLPIYNRLKAPRYHVLGNHDFAVGPQEKPKVLETLGLARGYYDFAHGPWRFVVLDGNDLSLIAAPKGSERYKEAEAMLQRVKESGAPNAMTWNGGLGTRQIEWLKATLSRASQAGERVVVFCHFPVHPPNVHNLWNSDELIGIMESHRCVVAYINGHNHRGNYAEKKGIHYLTVQGMVETRDTTAYAVVEVHGDRLRVIGVGREPSRVLKF